jgi:hypothetical protein
MVQLLNGTAEPGGRLAASRPTPTFGNPEQPLPASTRPAAGALLAEAGYGPQRPLRLQGDASPPSGSGQMLPLPMNEFAAAGPEGGTAASRSSFEVADWNTLLAAARSAAPVRRRWTGADVAEHLARHPRTPRVMARWLHPRRLPGRRLQLAGHRTRRAASTPPSPRWRPSATPAARHQPPSASAHARLVDDPPWLYIVHDLNPRAMTPPGARLRQPAELVRWTSSPSILQ